MLKTTIMCSPGPLSRPTSSQMLNKASMSKRHVTPNHARDLYSYNEDSVYRYCTPLEWRKLHRREEPPLPTRPGIFPFLALPAELRNAVYRELLITTIPLQLVHDRPSWPDVHTPGKQLDTVVLLLCQQVCNEGLAVLYGENTFYLHIDTTLFRYTADMHRLDQFFTLAPPITSHLWRIKRVVMHAGSDNHRTRTKYDLYRQLLNANIHMQNLHLFAIQFPTDDALRRNMRVNVEWLEKVSAAELERRAVWFPAGSMSDEGWLVMKRGRCDGRRIPGLGVADEREGFELEM